MKFFTPVILLLLLSATSIAQPKSRLLRLLDRSADTAYISDYSHKLVVRAFGLRKFNKYTLGQYSFTERVTYRANDDYSLGGGINYKWVGINIAYKLPLVNNDDDRFGKTRLFDLQSYLYLRKFAVDFYGLVYKGYYLSTSDLLDLQPEEDAFYIRNDIRTNNYGINFHYIFNDQKFSYRAAFLQNERQKKSAGSFITGGTLHYRSVKGDSAIIPREIDNNDFFNGYPFDKGTTIALGINCGYAYTHVFKKYFFVTAALSAGLGINYTTLNVVAQDDKRDRVNSQWNGIWRAAAGYNGEKYFIGAQYVNYLSRNHAPFKETWQQLQAGNVRLTFAQRFTLKKKVRKKLDKVEDFFVPDVGL